MPGPFQDGLLQQLGGAAPTLHFTAEEPEALTCYRVQQFAQESVRPTPARQKWGLDCKQGSLAPHHMRLTIAFGQQRNGGAERLTALPPYLPSPLLAIILWLWPLQLSPFLSFLWLCS